MGYRMIWGLLQQKGWHVNQKRIWRLWKKQGLKVPQKKDKKRSLGTAENGCTRLKAAGKDEVWAMNFVFGVTANGRSQKWLEIVAHTNVMQIILRPSTVVRTFPRR
jgi:putative transposase